MSFRFSSIAGVIPLLLILAQVAGCASYDKNAGSFVKVAPHDKKKKKKEEIAPELNLSYAQVLMRDEHYSEARKIYKEVLVKKPDCVEAVLGIAQLDWLAMRHEAAEEGYRAALRIAPDSPQVVDTVGSFYAEQERYAEASELFERAIELDPDQKLYHYHLGISLARSGRTNEAVPHLTQSVGAAVAHYNVARILYDQKRFDESEQHLLQATAKNPRLTEAKQWLDHLRSQRDSEISQRVNPAPQQSAEIAKAPERTQNAPLSRSTEFGINPDSQQVIAAGNVTRIQPGGAPVIVNQAASTQATIAANAPVSHNNAGVPGNSAPAMNNQTEDPSPTGFTPAQLEQMRNQRLKAAQQQASPSPAWNNPRSY